MLKILSPVIPGFLEQRATTDQFRRRGFSQEGLLRILQRSASPLESRTLKNCFKERRPEVTTCANVENRGMTLREIDWVRLGGTTMFGGGIVSLGSSSHPDAAC